MQAPSLAVPAVPAPRQALLEAPFWIVLLACALIPGSLAPWIEWNDLPLRTVELAIVAIAALYFVIGLPRRLGVTRWDAWKPLAPFLAAACYAALTLARSDLDEANTAAMGATLVFGLAAALLAASLVDSLPSAAIEAFLWRLTVFLAVVSVFYTAESILSLGLRSEANRAPLSDFGIDRVRGPLYGSATGYVGLLPALGFAVERSLARRSVTARLASLAFLLAIFGMGSRAGVILAGVYLLTLFATRQRLSRKMAMVFAVSTLGAIAAAAIFSRANTERLRSLSDSGRELTHRMAANYFEENSVAGLAAGSGYGGIWPWYLRDARQGTLVAAGHNMAWTPYGPSLYHSHSTALTMALELGLVGTAAFGWQFASIGGIVLRSRRSARWVALSGAVAVASLGFFFDLFLFKNTTVSLIWWIYLAALSRLASEAR